MLHCPQPQEAKTVSETSSNSDFDVMAQIVPELMLLNPSCVCGRVKETDRKGTAV